jgi:hypothetical protein
MRIVLTRHAQDMMLERGISIDFIKKAIQRGSTYQYVRVAYYVRHQIYVIKTVTLATRI